MVYIDYKLNQDKVYVITAIDSIKCKNTPYGLVELIKSAKIRRLDIPDFVLKFEIRPILDENYNHTEYGEIVMMSLYDNFADSFLKEMIVFVPSSTLSLKSVEP